MATIKRFDEIEAWKTARMLTNLVYKLSSRGRLPQDFGLRDQIRHAAVSIMSNIAEGFESRTQFMFVEYLGRARASAGELRAQLYVISDQGYCTPEDFREAFKLTETCSRQLYRFMEYLENHPSARRVAESTPLYDITST